MCVVERNHDKMEESSVCCCRIVYIYKVRSAAGLSLARTRKRRTRGGGTAAETFLSLALCLYIASDRCVNVCSIGTVGVLKLG